jgi:Thiamine pyrophosphate enzyme, C-terminal TPP binding domain
MSCSRLPRGLETLDQEKQEEAGIIPFGVEFKNPNFAKVAEAMGAKGIRIEDPTDVRDGLAEALAHKTGPVVVDAVVDPFALSRSSEICQNDGTGAQPSFVRNSIGRRSWLPDAIACLLGIGRAGKCLYDTDRPRPPQF